MSFYSGYQGQSIGRLLHFVYCYCGLHYAEEVIINEGVLKYAGKAFATYVWEGDIPMFKFENDLFNRMQESKREEAIEEGKPLRDRFKL